MEKYKFRGRSKSLGNSFKKLCWKFDKVGNFKKYCRSKSVERGKGSDDTSPTEGKSFSEEGVEVYLDSTSTTLDNDIWLINSRASFHMTPHRD